MSRAAIVTGGAGALGSEICRRLAADGLRVAIADRDLAGAQALLPTLGGSGHAAFAADTTDEASTRALFDAVGRDLGGAAVLVCVAGGSARAGRQRIADVSLEQWNAILALNVTSTFISTREYLRRRTEPVDGGRIVTVSSIAALAPTEVSAPDYATAKAAIVTLTKLAALEAAARGITVNSIAPGVIATERQLARGAEYMEPLRERTPSKRIGLPADVAATVSFLVSPDAQHITGTTIPIDGGTHLI